MQRQPWIAHTISKKKCEYLHRESQDEVLDDQNDSYRIPRNARLLTTFL